MRFTFLESLCDITHLKPLAIAAEACGCDGFAVPEGIRRLEEQGVTDVIVGFRNVYDPATVNQPVQEKSDAMRHYADTVIARCS